MRRRVTGVSGAAVLVLGLLLSGCSEDSGSEPITGEWQADGRQPPGYADFGDQAMIRVDEAGKAILGTSPSRLCGGAEVTAADEAEGASDAGRGEADGAAYRIAFASPCATVGVPSSLDVVVDGDVLKARPAGMPGGEAFRFRRAD
ncbi:hypothetical protein [Streptomyces indicus]|uniref:Lipoprotein n=1 Tax=Streptomyces indicus TaxID=417292 RepID=A0A1G8ZLB5_9ACTN|nr:hypothetical protein [Streptomyces indicus]SDK15404.1 hypothetical protein SAMN05421806_10539 [Streptomyces indicus]